jgi:hypothetical protein
MATEPPDGRPDSAKTSDGAPGIWQVAPAQTPGPPALRAVPGAGTMTDRRLRAQNRLRHEFTMADPLLNPPPEAREGRLGAEWPRVFPGL